MGVAAKLRPQYLALGEILRPHGIRGELRMRLETQDPQRLTELDHVYIGKSADDPKPESVKLEGVRFHQHYALLTLEGYRDRSTADRLRGRLVMLHIDDLTPLEDGEYYLFQLIGLTVREADERIGVVREILQTGANDVYIVDRDDGSELLLPAHEETIQSIDFSSGIISMRLPDGLLSNANS